MTISILEAIKAAIFSGFERNKRCNFCLQYYYLLPYDQYCSKICLKASENPVLHPSIL